MVRETRAWTEIEITPNDDGFVGLPKDRAFLVLWKGMHVGIMQFNKDDGIYSIIYNPIDRFIPFPIESIDEFHKADAWMDFPSFEHLGLRKGL